MKRLFTPVALALTLFVAAPAFALQTAPSGDRPLDHKSDAWWDRVEAQFTRSLDSEIAQVRMETVRNIIFFATYYPDKVDFNGAVGGLLDIYQFNKDDSQRTMALVALHTIGDEYSMQYIAQLVKRERSSRLRSLTMAMLADYQKNNR